MNDHDLIIIILTSAIVSIFSSGSLIGGGTSTIIVWRFNEDLMILRWLGGG